MESKTYPAFVSRPTLAKVSLIDKHNLPDKSEYSILPFTDHTSILSSQSRFDHRIGFIEQVNRSSHLTRANWFRCLFGNGPTSTSIPSKAFNPNPTCYENKFVCLHTADRPFPRLSHNKKRNPLKDQRTNNSTSPSTAFHPTA